MNLTFNECCEAISIRSYPDYFPVLYDEMVADGTIDLKLYAEQNYIINVNNKYGLFEKQLGPLLEGARKLLDDQPLLRYVNLLSKAMSDREKFNRTRGQVMIPSPEKPDIASDFAGMIAMLPMMDYANSVMCARNLPERYIRSEFKAFEGCIDACERRYGRPAMNQVYFQWLQHYIDITIVRFGSLNFERRQQFPSHAAILKHKSSGEIASLMYNKKMHRDGMVLGSAGYTDEVGSYNAEFIETDEYFEGFPSDRSGFCKGVLTRYPKNEWELALKPGDPCISVHIPRGANLSGDACDKSYAEALEVYGRCFPEFKPKAMVCFSWLMDTRLDDICGGAPNIVNFQKPYHAFPVSSAGKEIFSFVFIWPYEKLEDLPEDTRLMRALKKRYLEGNYVHSFGGVFMLEPV